MKRKLGVLGASGLLGSDLINYLSSGYTVTPITRESYEEHKGDKFDVFINANGNSKRFWALQNIYQDFEASTSSVYKTIFDFKFKKYIYISSIDVYPDPSSARGTLEDDSIDISQQNAYGFHKYLSEQLVKKHVSDWLILRSSMILGTKIKKGPFYDILSHNPTLLTFDSKLQLITTNAIARIIKVLLDREVVRKTFNLGGIGTFTFTKISKYFDQEIQVSPKAEKQVYKMNVRKIRELYPSLKTSEEYLQEFLNDYKDE